LEWTRQILARTAATPPATLAGMNRLPKLQRAARAFLLRLVAENGIEEAARVLRELADQLERLPDRYDEEGDPADHEAH